jgi:hypothetical protein
MQDNMGGEKSWCFLKAPTNFLKQLSDVVEIFMFNAHKRLMKNVNEDVQLKTLFNKNIEEIENMKEELLKAVKSEKNMVNRAVNA